MTALNLKSDTRQANWRRANPKRYQAHLTVEAALRRGELVRHPCEVCGTTEGRIDAHHDDYDKPLEVRWLCRLHHVRHHFGGPDLFTRNLKHERTNYARPPRRDPDTSQESPDNLDSGGNCRAHRNQPGFRPGQAGQDPRKSRQDDRRALRRA